MVIISLKENILYIKRKYFIYINIYTFIYINIILYIYFIIKIGWYRVMKYLQSIEFIINGKSNISSLNRR